MNSPRHFRLIRTRDLKAFQRALLDLITESDPWRARQTAVLVPTTAAAAQLRRTRDSFLSEAGHTTAVRVAPSFLTRDSWYSEMHLRSGVSDPLLTSIERDVCMLAAAREAERSDAPPPFKLRHGLIPSVVGLYDQLMRCRRSVDAFERLMTTDLEPSLELDRGARRLLRQTKFLVTTFRRYEARIAKAGRIDEHGLRRLLTRDGMSALFSRVILTIPDHVVDPAGLWPADFDLLTRQPGLERVEVVATDRVLDSGFYERITDLLPDIVDERLDTGDVPSPVVVTPCEDRHHFVWRDREEELLAVIRSVKASMPRRSATEDAVPEPAASTRRRVGVVFRRRLPYLYLARRLFRQAGVTFETLDALPLAAEPYAAALDLVCAFVISNYDRSSTIALLSSPHFAFDQGLGVSARAVESLDRRLREVGFDGGRPALVNVIEGGAESDLETDDQIGALDAARTAVRLATELRPLENTGRPSAMLSTLGAFLRRYAVTRPVTDPLLEREEQAHTAIWSAVSDLERAHQRLDDAETSFGEIVSMLRRWVEGQTFEPRTGAGGVQLVDAQAAPYGRFDDLFIIGLIDGEWPERVPRNIFYPSSLLIPLGWSRERELLAAERARFGDLLELSWSRVSLSTVSLENDAVVTPSGLLEEVDEAGLQLMSAERQPATSVTQEDALALAEVEPGALAEPASSWLAMRTQTRDWSAPRFRGFVGHREAAGYAVRALEQYLECPFKYFADRVLKLADESTTDRMVAAQRRGRFVHQVFESFFRKWHREGNRAITVATFDTALDVFRLVAEDALRETAPGDRAVTRAWMMGSVAASGLAERLFMLEVDHPADVVERLTEFRVDGELVVGEGKSSRTVQLRGVADRVDLFSDGTFRVIDYKANRAPDRSRSLQLPLYARGLEHLLTARDRRPWHAGEAAYVAFGEPRLRLPLGRGDLASAIEDGQRRAINVIRQIEQGDYPVRPAEPYGCAFCAYPTVCRKDYVADE